MAEQPTMSAKEFLDALKMESEKGTTLSADQLQERAVGALHSLRGLQRSDKLKVLRRMRKLLDA